MICFYLKGNSSLPGRYSYWLVLLDDKADIFGASLLISYCSFSSLTWWSVVTIILYIHF